ncbi:hypothetical protein FALBO_15689 [Fusarium albosuccineum]|uniref:Uncharacterized protein n=1 Tax=Fusarium albosuccineum TaxID=1237068 RepID=A0A8H4KT33_9HYPO|nr:hypothetical protein FALBO_15689 [Fusarium albosuccineum]
MAPEYSEVPTSQPHERSQHPVSPLSSVGSRRQSPFLDRSSPQSVASPAFGRRQDSHMGLLGPNQTPRNTNAGLGVFEPNRRSMIARTPKPWWKKLFRSKWAMLICLAYGVAGALGHHFLYWHLNGREARDQQWWLRLGQFISFNAKAGFVLAVIMAHQQAAWRAVGQQRFSVKTVDALFGAAHDITEIFHTEAWKRCWVVMFLALYFWVSPLVVIFTSATLNVVSRTTSQDTMCPSVRTLNFSHEENNNWRDPNRAGKENLMGLSVSLWNETASPDEDPDYFDYWDSPSKQFSAIAFKVFYGEMAVQKDNVAMDICGAGWNCTTTINFVGPGYKCDQLAKDKDDEVTEWAGVKAPFNVSDFAPLGNHTYWAVADQGEYKGQINSGSGGHPKKDKPYPKNLGAFKTEPIIWLGYAAVDNVTEQHPENRSAPGWDEAYTPTIFACEHYETNYTVNMSWTGGLQTYNVTKRDYLRKVVNTTYLGNNAKDGLLDKTLATPEENYVFPQDIRNYRRTAAYHSIGKKLRDLINGYIQMPTHNSNSEVFTSRLIDRHDYLAVPDFQKKLQEVYEDILISLFSDPQMLAVAWAADPSKQSGVGAGDSDTNYPCMRQRTANQFHYQWEVLFPVYLASFIIATFGVAYGIFAMAQDGVDEQRETTFSSIAGATKGVSLDQKEDRDTKIKCWPVEERPGSRAYEFRVEERPASEIFRPRSTDKNGYSVRASGEA